MSKVSITRSLLDDLAMSISAKSGEPVPMTLAEMKDAVDDIQTGGSPTLQSITKSYTPTESQQTETITAGSGYDGIEEVDVTVGAISSTYVGSGITQRSSSDLTASGATVTVPSGYYSAQASKAVANGTAGTPTATKGTVSNHSVSVTPSVTNTTGYITGSTINGTAVTVTASELASGNKAITQNGTDIDVVGYSTVSVDVPSGGGSVTVTDEANATGTTCVITSGGSPTPSETWETLFEGNENINAETPYNGFWIEALSDVPITVGSVWRIAIDGVNYGSLTATNFSQYGGIIGNPLYIGGADDGSGIPFNFVNPNWGAWYGGSEFSVGTHYFKIERLVTE